MREMEGRVRAEETARETSQQMATHRGSFLEKVTPILIKLALIIPTEFMTSKP